MYQGKKILAIIPARSGSKGLPNKNILPLNNIPLLAHSVLHAKESGLVDYIFLSTDSEEYAQIGRDYGAQVPFLRPAELSQDLSCSWEVVVHVLDGLEQQRLTFDYFILLQPTSPLRTAQDVSAALKLAVDEHLTSVVSLCEAEHPLNYYNVLDNTQSLDGFLKNIANRQQMRTHYRVTGCIYVSTCKNYRQTKSYYVPNSKAYLMPASRSLDIDTAFDFKFAQFFLERYSQREKFTRTKKCSEMQVVCALFIKFVNFSVHLNIFL